MSQKIEFLTSEPELVAIAHLREHPENPNKGDVDTISDSLEENGWYGSIIAQRSTGYILAGNHRYRAAKRKGATEIWVEYADVDDRTALTIMLADNRYAQLARLDTESLASVLTHVQDSVGDLTGTGFDAESMREMVEMTQPEQPQASGKTAKEAKERYDKTQTRQIVFVFEQEEYERMSDRLTRAAQAAGATNNAETILWLVRQHRERAA